MNKKELLEAVGAKFPQAKPSDVKKIALATLDTLATDLRSALWQGGHISVLMQRDMDSQILLRSGEVRNQLSRSIIFKAALAEVAFKKPGRKKLPAAKLKKNKKK